MLTNTSGINVLTGYQVQLDRPSIARSSNINDPSRVNRNDTDDTVNISSEAKALQQVYEEKKQNLEQDYNSDAQQLEQKYLQEKKRLEGEFSQKKQSLEINLYA